MLGVFFLIGLTMIFISGYLLYPEYKEFRELIKEKKWGTILLDILWELFDIYSGFAIRKIVFIIGFVIVLLSIFDLLGLL